MLEGLSEPLVAHLRQLWPAAAAAAAGLPRRAGAGNSDAPKALQVRPPALYSKDWQCCMQRW